MENFLKIVTLILISSVKFVFGPSFAYLNNSYDYTWLETNIYAIIGGMMGVIIFMYLSEWLIDKWHKIKVSFYRKRHKLGSVFSEPIADIPEQLEIHYQYIEKRMPQKKVFTRRSRRMVSLWKKYGLMGLAVLTPVLFSIPIGTFFMARLEKNKKRILLYMFLSITCWSLIITTFLHLSHV